MGKEIYMPKKTKYAFKPSEAPKNKKAGKTCSS
jgi:hypothetical protein